MPKFVVNAISWCADWDVDEVLSEQEGIAAQVQEFATIDGARCCLHEWLGDEAQEMADNADDEEEKAEWLATKARLEAEIDAWNGAESARFFLYQHEEEVSGVSVQVFHNPSL